MMQSKNEQRSRLIAPSTTAQSAVPSVVGAKATVFSALARRLEVADC